MAVLVRIKGQIETDEYKAGMELKRLFESALDFDLEGDITIISNVILFGQEIKDIDLVVFGQFGTGFVRKLKFRPKGNDDYITKNVYFSNFCFAIELKKHSVKDIHLGATNNLLVTYNGKKHDVTYQSELQKYSLFRYLRNMGEEPKNFFVTNFIWLKNVSSKELLQLKNKGEHNILPSTFSIDWLLMLLLSQNKPFERNKSHQPYWGLQCWRSSDVEYSSLENAFDLFENVKKNVGAISRASFERMSRRVLEGQKYAEAILNDAEKGGKFVIIQGKAGTGKTVQLLNIACDLCLNYQKRCLILTYNFTLVADIRRTLTFAHIPDGIGKESVKIMTLYKFFIDLFEGFGIYEKDQHLDDVEFFNNYDLYCKQLIEFILQNKKENRDIEVLMKKNQQLLSWDYILIDEAQDWSPFEVDILYSIFGPSKIVISQAPDQKVRPLQDPKWVKPKWRIDKDFVQTNRRKSLRQKENLVHFVNHFAEKHNLSWELEATGNPESKGGKVIITTKYTSELHNTIYKECLKSGNKAYEMLFLVPPSMIVADGEKPIKIDLPNGESVEKKIKQKHCSLVDDFKDEIDFWDGTNKELRRDYPVKIDQHRLIQYESCRGLEGWSVVCIELDELVKYLDYKYKEDTDFLELALESPEEKKNRYIYMWTLIPLTRAIDTLIITVKNKNSKISLKLFELYQENKDFVQWID